VTEKSEVSLFALKGLKFQTINRLNQARQRKKPDLVAELTHKLEEVVRRIQALGQQEGS
jgi:hypothetical protein